MEGRERIGTGFQGLSAFQLRVLAMAAMLCDHMWRTVCPTGGVWMTCVGRLAFPIFAFQLVEGYLHTHNLQAYVHRLLLAALLAELPFDWMLSPGIPADPFYQNVLFTLLLGLGMIHWMDRILRSGGQPVLRGIQLLGICLLGFLAGTIAMVDYAGPGVLLIICFYLARRFRPAWLIQLGGMVLVHGILLRGIPLPIPFFGLEGLFTTQTFALLALPLLWCYRGRQGYHSPGWRWFCYAFYPGHLLLLVLLTRLG